MLLNQTDISGLERYSPQEVSTAMIVCAWTITADHYLLLI